MRFHEHRLLRTGYKEVFKRIGAHHIASDAKAFYADAIVQAQMMNSFRALTQIQLEKRWELARCPYYSVYPSILPPLLKLKLDDIEGDLIKPPLEVLSIRLPADGSNPLSFDWQGESVEIREILMGRIFCNPTDPDDRIYRRSVPLENVDPGMTLWVDIGECTSSVDVPDLTVPIQSYRNVRLVKGVTVESELCDMDEHESASKGIVMPLDAWRDCFRLAVTLCLLENDPTIIEPEVLAKDQSKFDITGDEKYLDRAKRRGKVGWSIGRKLEVIPHVRRPHPFKVWTGKGRAIPKIVMRKGSIVHRKVVEKLPTGYGGSDS